MENLFMIESASPMRLLELALVMTITGLFIGRLIMVSAYQERTGDYFDIKLMLLYPSPDVGQALEGSRFKILTSANLLAKIMWLSGLVLAILCLADRHFF